MTYYSLAQRVDLDGLLAELDGAVKVLPVVHLEHAFVHEGEREAAARHSRIASSWGQKE